MKETYDYIVVGGGSSGCVAAARLVTSGARVLLLEGGYSHRHPLLDMPPGIFKMINGSKFMRYHQTIPQEHLDGRIHAGGIHGAVWMYLDLAYRSSQIGAAPSRLDPHGAWRKPGSST